MNARWTVLVVDDAQAAAEGLKDALRAAKAEVRTATTVMDAVQLQLESPADVVIVDVELHGESGLGVLEALRSEGKQTPVLLVSLRDDAMARERAFHLGADDYLVKPFAPAELIARAQRRLELSRLLATARDEAQRLEALALTDGLTQVANHRSFQQRLSDEFRRAQRYDDPLGLILVDLDHFKAINDGHGHQVGDQVLVRVADAMRHAVRETDFVARYGGEEFAVVLPKTHLAGALTVAERIVAGLKTLQLGSGLRVTASFGVSGFPGRSVSTAEQLVRTADEALYRAKREGRNRISLYQATAYGSVGS